ncbi:MAG: type II secretion system protein GspM, partial [Gammaproteobacteria bacterium]
MNAENLRKLRTRVDTMSLRERLFVFAALVVVLLALVQLLLIDPVQARRANAQARLQAADAALAEIAVRQAAFAAHGGRDPDEASRAALGAHEARLAELDAALEQRMRALVPPERMPQVLREVARGGPGVRVAGFRSLEPQPLQPGGDAGAPPGIWRHGFEITLAGHYGELVAYLERLESLPWRF